MAFNKISAGQQLPGGALPISLGAGGIFMLPAGQGVVGTFGSVLSPQLASGNELTGQYIIQMGQYSTLQIYDPTLQYWRNIQVSPMGLITVSSDGANYRIANTTGCPVGAVITNVGSSLTNGFNTVTVTPSAGGSVWSTIVGGSINTTITITNAGTGFLAPPTLVFTPPASQGTTPYVLPTAVCTLSTGTIGSVTVINEGAGLVAAPTLTIVNQPGDTAGGGAILTVNATLANSGKLLALYPSANTTQTSGIVQAGAYGTPQTSVPTFTTFSPASTIAATMIMNFSITGFTNTTAGVTYVNAGGVFTGGMCAATAAASSVNPILDLGLSYPIFPPISVASTTGVPSLFTNGFSGVNIQAVPKYTGVSAASTVATVVAQPPTVGGVTDTILFMSI